MSDGNYALGGSKGDSALVTLVDPNGNVLWSRGFRSTPGYEHTVYQLAPTPDGDIIGTGNAYDGNPYPEFTFLFKFDLAGNLIWHTRAEDARPIWTNRILPTSSSSYMALPCIYDLTSITLSDLYSARVDALTGLMISNGPRTDFTPVNPGLDEHYSATIAPDGSVYACGRVFLYGDDPTSMRPHVTHYDASGAMLWSRCFMYPVTETARIYGIDIIHNDDSLTVCYFGDIDGATTNYNSGLIRMDEQGNVAWTKDYNLPDFTADLSYKVLRMPYGYAVTGYGTGERDLFVLAVDLSGNVLWCNRYGTAGIPEFLPRTVTPNAVALGSDILLTATQEIAGDRNIIYARVDAAGNVDCAISQSVDVVVTVVPPFVEDLTPVEYPDAVQFQTSSTTSAAHFPSNTCTALSLDLGPDQFACGPVELTADLSGANFLWSTGSTSSQTTVNGPDTVWLEAHIGCCVLSDTIIIHPGDLPVALFNADVPPCGLSVDFLSNSQNTSDVEWSFGDGSFGYTTSIDHTYGTTGEFDVQLVAINACGSDTTIETIALSAGGVLELVGPAVVCLGSDVELSFELTDDTPTSQIWSSGGEGATETILAISAEVSIGLSIEGASGCSYSAQIELAPTPTPTAQFTQLVQECGTIVEFYDGSLDATELNWDLGNGSTSQLASPQTNYPANGTFTVLLVASNACGSDSSETVISSIPSGTLLVQPDTVVCFGQEVSLSLALIDAQLATSTWTTGETDVSTITFTTIASVDIGVEVVDNVGCLYSGSTYVSVSPVPIAEFTFEASPCSDQVQISNGSQLADSFEWFIAGQLVSTGTQPTLVISNTDGEFVSLVAMNSCGSDTLDSFISLPDVPSFSISGPALICSTEPIRLSIVYGGISELSIVWSNGETTSEIELDPVDGAVIEASAQTTDGCSFSASFPIDFVGDNGSVSGYIPNVFTPNGDEHNEVFAPVVLSGFESLTIFNRWGEELYETKDSDKPWTGQYKGEAVPDGTYVYIVRWRDGCTRKTAERVGHVTVLR